MRLLSALVALGLLLAATSASAWVRSRTSRGHELYWLETDITWHLDDAGCADLPDDDSEHEAVRTSWDTWDAVQCSYGHFRMTFHEGSLLHATRAEYVEQGGNRNVLLWVDQDEWDHSSAVIGVTSATYDARDGQVLDADIEFNDSRFRFSTTDRFLARRTDVQNTATHEIGHVLGLDHTQIEEATMAERAEDGEIIKRDLHQDDIDGLCEVVPPPGAYDKKRSPLSGGSPGNEGGCECGLAAGARGSGSPTAGVLLLGACVGWWTRRRRRRV